MGNRQDKSSPRHGTPRDFKKEEQARVHYQTRANWRPKQVWLDFNGNPCQLRKQVRLVPNHFWPPYLSGEA